MENPPSNHLSNPKTVALNASQQSNILRSNKLLQTADMKQERSHDFFKGTRISSCSFVKMKGGVALAQPYYAKPPLSFADKMAKSSYTSSASYDQFKPKANLHCGSAKKPLEPYNPTSYRSRLPLPDNQMPSKNASQIEIGERGEKYTRHFISHSKNQYGNFGKIDPVTNTGILAERTKWHHKMQNK